MVTGAKGGAHLQINESQTQPNSEDTGTQYADDSICLFQIITPPFLSLQLDLVQPGQVAVLVKMENSRIIDHSGFVIAVCSLLSILANANLKKRYSEKAHGCNNSRKPH